MPIYGDNWMQAVKKLQQIAKFVRFLLEQIRQYPHSLHTESITIIDKISLVQ